MHTRHEKGQNKTARTQSWWMLYRHGRQMSCLVTDLVGGGVEVTLVRSDREPRAIHVYAVRDDAMAAARRLATSWLALGWTIHGTRGDRAEAGP